MAEIQSDKYQFWCPYCFCKKTGQKLTHDSVLFRSETVFRNESELMKQLTNNIFSSKEDLTLDMDNLLSPTQSQSLLVAYDQRAVFIQGTSRAYNDFWKDYAGGTTEPESKAVAQKIKRGQERPVISPKEAGQAAKDAFLTDDDGFVYGMKDIFGNETTQRVCPHCHNPLPPLYGKYPIHYISVIGTSGAGKTVFLSQFIKNFSNVNAMFGLPSMHLSTNEANYVENNKIEINVTLPQGTDPGTLQQPLFYNLQRNRVFHTFVFYDIAGEDCVDDQVMSRYSSFIKHSSGIIFLIDPRQIPVFGLELRDGEKVDEPRKVLDTVRRAFPGDQQTDIPLAIVISKSDQCRNVLGACKTLYQPNITKVYDNIRDALSRPMFNAAEYNEIAEYLDGFMQAQVPDLWAIVSQNYNHYNYFAFSAIGCDVQDNMPVDNPLPYRIQEPFFWILKEIGMLGTNAPVFPKISREKGDAMLRDFVEKLGKPGVFAKKYDTPFGRIRADQEVEYLKKEADIKKQVDTAYRGGAAR
ncbi:MAG: GTPase domain-containing protein [Oscillospiraceae bacterium]|nr:GTPase domain-containing protein [Oscillospiraceae bacterium]